MINVILHVALPPLELFNLFYISVFILLPAGLIYTLTIYVKFFRVIRESAKIQSSSGLSMSSLKLPTTRNKEDTIDMRDYGLNSGNSYIFMVKSISF